MKPFAVLCLLVLSTVATAAQPVWRAVDTLPLVSPAKGAVVETIEVLFSWSPRPDSASYILTIQRSDVLESISISYPGGDFWCDSFCTVGFEPSEHDWVWKENATYKWQVRARDAEFGVIAKSKKRPFVVDMLKPIVIESPAEGEIVEAMPGIGNHSFNLTVSSAVDAAADYKARLYNKDGTIVSSSDYFGYNCSPQCVFNLLVPPMPSGQTKRFYVQVKGSHPNVAGKMKSPKIAIKIHMP